MKADGRITRMAEIGKIGNSLRIASRPKRWALKPNCKNGHPFRIRKDNTRYCPICRSAWERQYQIKKKACASASVYPLLSLLDGKRGTEAPPALTPRNSLLTVI
jgi:hypothetical protein